MSYALEGDISIYDSPTTDRFVLDCARLFVG